MYIGLVTSPDWSVAPQRLILTDLETKHDSKVNRGNFGSGVTWFCKLITLPHLQLSGVYSGTEPTDGLVNLKPE